MSETARVWFITGATSGFGKEMTVRALEKGDVVVATGTKMQALAGLQSKYPPTTLLVRKADVTRREDIVDAFSAAKAAFGRIDVVFNNAAQTIVGELEGTPVDAARHLFDVNFWGAVAVSLEAVKFFREINGPETGGRLLISSSMYGIAPCPLGGWYVATKHALEGFSETLERELDPMWNIKITLIEPGFFQTRMVTTTGAVAYPARDAYKDREFLNQIRATLLDNADAGDPWKAVREMYTLSTLHDPPLRLVLGKDALSRVKEKLASVAADMEKYESWSNDLAMY